MKKLLLIIILLVGFNTVQLKAQEFKLPVVFIGGNITRPVTFGFDANASDSMTDTQWGESLLPGIYQSGDLEVRLTSKLLGRTYLVGGGSGISDDGGHTDIRRKPVQDSFILQYEIYNTKWDYQFANPVSLQWDNTTIPPIIKHIYMAPEGAVGQPIRLDMKTVNHFDIPDSIDVYTTMLITLLYNRETRSVPRTNEASGELMVFPNPMDSRSILQFMLKEDSHVTLSAYDITGKKIFERIINGYAGENEAGIGRNDFSAHPGVYLLRLSGIENANSFQKTTTLIVQ